MFLREVMSQKVMIAVSEHYDDLDAYITKRAACCENWPLDGLKG